MNQDNFNLYTTDDLIHDEDFREIVRGSDSDNRINELLKNHPEKQHEIKVAVQIINGLDIKSFKQPYLRKKELWQPILQTQKRRVRFLYLRYAASLLLLVGIGSSIFNLKTHKRNEEVIAVKESPSINAKLILADGKTVSITSKQSNIRYSTDGTGIVVNDTSGIAQSVPVEGLNQLIVPYGKRSYIVLSEGTKVWLNSGSKLVFPPVFRGKTREVVLEGEALFDVAKNKEIPFYVKTDAFKMKVYGTVFNVQVYFQDNDYSVVLVEGKVSMIANDNVQSPEVFLAPNQKATMSKGKKDIEVVNVENTEVYTAWKDGYLTFTNEEVTDLLKRVSRYYNIEIDVKLSGKNERIYGKLDLKDSLERVLNGIAFISKTKYEKQGNRYVFNNN